MWRTNANTIEGERARTATQLFFPTGFARKRRRPGEMSSLEKSMGKPLTAQDQDALPRRRSRSGTANSLNRASFWSASITSRTYIIWCTVYMVLASTSSCTTTNCSSGARPRLRCRWRPGASSEETGTMGQLYSSAAFFFYPTTMHFTAGVAGAFSALHNMWKAWCKQEKKKCGFMVCYRERPAWWGRSRENETRT